MAHDGSSKSSLDALLPGYSHSVDACLTLPPKTSTRIPAISKDSPAPDGFLTPEEEVEYLSRLVFLIVLDEPRPQWLEAHISPAFRADFDNFPASQTWKEHVETFQIIHKTNPGYSPEVLNIVVDVSEHVTHAEALFLIQTVGRPENVRRHSTARLKWRRREGRWQIYHIWGVRVPFASFDNI